MFAGAGLTRRLLAVGRLRVASHCALALGLIACESELTESSPSYALDASWGDTGTGEGQFSVPYGSEIDLDNTYIYITDCRNHRIQRFNLDGTFSRMWGTNGTGTGELDHPADIKVDGHGNVYVVEQLNHRVQKFTADGDPLTFLGSFGREDGQFDNPIGLGIDGDDNLYVVEYGNHRVQKFSADGRFLTKWGVRGKGDGEFEGPYYVETDSENNVYVVDRGNHRIQKFTSAGVFLFKWGRNGGDGTAGAGAGEFDWPHEIAIDADDRVYVADSRNHRFQIFTSRGDFLRQWGDASIFGDPKTIAVDRSYHVYISDTQFVMGTYVTRWRNDWLGR